MARRPAKRWPAKCGVPPNEYPMPILPSAIDRRTRHPAEEPVRRVGALLAQRHARARWSDPELVPADAAAAAARVHRVHGDDRLAIAELAIHEPRHDFVALRVEPALGAGLRHAVGELPTAQILIRRDGDLVGPGDASSSPDPSSPRRTSTHTCRRLRARLLSCAPPVAITMFGAPRGGSALPVEVGVVEEVDAVDDDALLGRGLALEHPGAIDDAGVLLDEVVAGARRARSSRPARPRDADSRETAAAGTRSGSTGRTDRARADGVAHRIRPLRAGAAPRPAGGPPPTAAPAALARVGAAAAERAASPARLTRQRPAD